MKDFTSKGKVAANNKDWYALPSPASLPGKNDKICSMMFLNSLLNILSASSMTNILHESNLARFLAAKSKTAPGVPTNTCTGSFNLMISSLKEVPPVVTMTWIPKCFPKVLTTWDVCKANSLVGTKINAWILFTFGFNFSKVGITKDAVLPVPFLAAAKISAPINAIGILSSWIGDGFSKPASKMPINNSRFKWSDSKVFPLVPKTSSVCGRKSFTGRFNSDFQLSCVAVI